MALDFKSSSSAVPTRSDIIEYCTAVITHHNVLNLTYIIIYKKCVYNLAISTFTEDKNFGTRGEN